MIRRRYTPRTASLRFVVGRVAAVAGVVAAVTVVVPRPPAEAASSPANQRIRLEQTFYAYANAGETLHASFVKLAQRGGTPADVVVTVTAPDGSTTSCNALTNASANGTACTFTALSSATAGIWSLHFDPLGAGTSGDPESWNIEVRSAGGGAIGGRVYTEEYILEQPVFDFPNIRFWYATRDGYRYRATYNGYQGVDSVFRSDPVGVERPAGSCTPAHASAGIASETPGAGVPALGACGDPVKLFFETPDASMPATATIAGGTDWLLPAPATPTITNLRFTPSTPTSRSGTISFDADNFSGTLDVRIDANNDGDVTDAVDRTIHAFTAGGATTVAFDGNDGQGNPIPLDQAFVVRTDIDRVGEAHFVNSDVEVRSGGLEVLALNGPAAGSFTLYWNDTVLNNASHCSITPQKDGSAGVNSSGGVHAWAACPGGAGATNQNNGVGGGWGDVRSIDDWAFQPYSTSALVSVPAPPRTIAIDKRVISSTPAGNGEFDVAYDIDVTNTGVVGTTYDLDDTLQYGSGVGVVSRSVVNTAPGSIPTNPVWTGAAPDQRVASGIAIAAGIVHTYRVTVRASVPPSTTDAARDCTLQGGELGTGFRNTVSLTSEGETFDDVDCVGAPHVGMTKSLVGAPTANGDGTYTVAYDVVVSNTGAAAGEYDLSDTLRFGAGMSVVSASVANTVPGSIATAPSWNGAANPGIASGVPIAAGGSHTYRVTVQAGVPLAVSSAARDCTLGAGESGTGFLNGATMTSNGQTVDDDACAPVGAVTIDKSLVGPATPNGDGTFTVLYDVVVANPTDTATPYSLADRLEFGAGTTVMNASVANTTPGSVAVNPSWDGAATTTVASSTLASGAQDVFRVTVRVASPLSIPSFAADCALQAGETGTGLRNSATVTHNGLDQSDTDCAALPSATITKDLTSAPVANGDGTMTTTYEIVVTNTGGVNTAYDLDDTLRLGDGITVVSSGIAATSPSVPVNPTWTGIAPTTRAVTGRGLAAGATHRYTVTVRATVSPTIAATAADCTLQGGESGTGFLNTASMTSNGSTLTDDACAPAPLVVVSKAVRGPAAANGDGTWTTPYRITVTNPGSVTLDYELHDRLRFGAGTTVTDADVVATSPGGLAVDPDWDGDAHAHLTPVTDIAGGDTHTYDIDVTAQVPTAVTTTARDCSLSGTETGTGFLNTAELVHNGQLQSASACADVPQVNITKTVASGPTANGDGTTTVTFDVNVANPSNADADYEVFDDLEFGDGVTVDSSSATTASAGATVDPTWTGDGATTRLGSGTVAAGGSHRYTISVVAATPATVHRTAADCTVATGESGTGLRNSAQVVLNGRRQDADACAPLPHVVMHKELVGTPVGRGDGRFDVAYDVVVENDGDAPAVYDLDDHLRFGPGVTVSGATVVNAVPGTVPTDGAWNGVASTRVASAVALDADTTHRYRVSVVATMPAAITPTAADCAMAGGESGTGLDNVAVVTTNGHELTDDACGELPILTLDKTLDGSVRSLGDGVYVVRYRLVVKNTGATPTVYDLDDTPQPGAGVTLLAADVVDSDPALPSSDAGWNGAGNPRIATRRPIGAGATHTVTVALRLRVAANATAAALDCTLAAGESGTGAWNAAALDHDGRQLTDDACATLPTPTPTPTTTATGASPSSATGTGTTGGSSAGTSNRSGVSSTGNPLATTGSSVAGEIILAIAALIVGSLLLGSRRRSRRPES